MNAASVSTLSSGQKATGQALLQEARIDLAAALRWAARLGLNEGVDNHFSLAVADDDGVMRGNRFLINPFGWHWSEITASSLVLCDAAGNVLEGDNDVEATAFYIHSRIHLNVPHAVAVMHTHMPYTTSLTLLEDGRLEMCEQNALAFYNRIAYDDEYGGVALDNAEGDRIAGKIGDCSVLMMASHGVTVTGPTVRDAFNDLYYLERACMFQVLAGSTGKPLRQLSDNAIRKTAAQMADEMPKVAERHFTALKRILAKENPEYLN
jgi:ribulose-5-phosphate 4-epimerase/fuculose-1-phosphate aldolase